MEAGAAVPAERGAGEDARGIVVLDPGQETFRVVGRRLGRGGLAVDERAVQLEVVGGEHLGLVAVQVRVVVPVVLVAHEDVQVVLAELLRVVQQLLGVQGGRPGVGLGHGTAGGGELAVEHVGHVRGPVLVHVQGGVQGELEVLQEGEVRRAVHVVGVALVVVRVQLVGHQRVRVREDGPGEAGVHPVAVVHHPEAVLVDHHLAGGVPDVQRIDGRHPGGEGPDVTRAGGVPVVRERVVLVARVGHVPGELHPRLGLPVQPEAGRQALHVGVEGDALVVQPAERRVGVHLLGTAHRAQVVLLADGIPVAGLHPVVREQEVVLPAVVREPAQGGPGIEFPVLADEGLALRDGVHQVAQAAVGARFGHRLVREQPGFARVVPLVHEVVLEGRVVRLVVLRRVGDVVVVLQGAGVQAHLRVQRDDGVLLAGALGRDDDDAVRAAGAVQGVGGGVLEDGHRFHVLRVDHVHVLDGHAVHDEQRALPGVDGTETADADGRRVAGGAGGGAHLHARHLSVQGGSDGGDLRLGEFVGLHHLRGAREGLLGGGTESHDDGLVQHLGVFLEDDVDDGASAHGNGLFGIADGGEHEDGVGGDGEGIPSVHIRDGALGRALDHHAGADDRKPFGVGHRARDGLRLGRGRPGGEERRQEAKECR